jgi:hypothetical protein
MIAALEAQIDYEVAAVQRLDAIPMQKGFQMELIRQNAIWRRVCRIFAAREQLAKLQEAA